jgi:serine protease Do
MGIPGLQQMPEQMLEQAPEQQTDSVKRKIGGGTGFIISADGLVLTNKHVIADSQAEYSVLLSDGTTMYATVLSKDPINDLAFIQLYTDQDRSDKPSELIPVELGNSDKLQVGSKVIAIGNALSEFDNTTTSGIISGLGRSITASNGNGSTSRLSNLLQTDASINPGNSGGPLVNILGQVIGINTAIAQSANGIGFAIPINEAKAVVKSVQEFGKIVRPMLGVRYVEISQEIATELELPVDYGAFLQDDIARGVRSVLEDGPADKAGLRGGDIILAINGVALNQSTSLQREIAKFMPADTIKLTIYRADKEIDINVKLGEFSAEST